MVKPNITFWNKTKCNFLVPHFMSKLHVMLLICQLRMKQYAPHIRASAADFEAVCKSSIILGLHMWNCLKQWVTFSSKGLRHLLRDFGQSLGIWFHNCNPLLICWVTLKRFKIHKSCSKDCWCLLHLNSCWIKHSQSLAHRNRESGRSDGGKAYLYGSVTSP